MSDTMVNKIGYLQDLSLLGIKDSQWEKLTLVEVINKFNTSKANVNKFKGTEEDKEEFIQNLSEAYNRVRLVVLQGGNKKIPKLTKKEKEEQAKEEEDNQKELEKANASQIDFDSMIPKCSIPANLPRIKMEIPFRIEEKMMKEGSVLPLTSLVPKQHKYQRWMKHYKNDLVMLPEEKSKGEILIYSDVLSMVKIQIR